MRTELDLIAVCHALIGKRVKLSPREKRLTDRAKNAVVDAATVDKIRAQIDRGMDPLGEAFTKIRSTVVRRQKGAIYTPRRIVRSMIMWVAQQGTPGRIVDPGAGSGRFILAAGDAFPKARLIAVEMDPLAALMLRANVQVRGWARRTSILVDDYRKIGLPQFSGTTAFIGNPPYVRHHDIPLRWKTWYRTKFDALGIKASALAGLHLHFFLQTKLLAKPGDIGAFITSAEWMDVNYGSALRQLLLEDLGGVGLHVLEPTVEAFPGTATTGAITCFRAGELPGAVKVRSVDSLARLNGLTKGTDIPRETLQAASRWSIIIRPSGPTPEGFMELGELFRVHRGQVTGANGIWIAGDRAEKLPAAVRIPAVTKAKDLIQAGLELNSVDMLRRVIDLPAELDMFDSEEKREIQSFLRWAKKQGAHQSYIAQHRKAWWSVGLREPAPILCTYMARRPPQFTYNRCEARHINIAHGLYPKEFIKDSVLKSYVTWLNNNIHISNGRTYAGGLTKFEPKEIERLKVPSLELLSA